MSSSIIAAALAALSFSPTVFADDSSRGSVTIVGNGLASAAPERVEISVSVVSLCYDTSRGAKDANAMLANEVLASLRSFATNERDEVTASGGPNVRQTEYVYNGNEPRILCERKWRSTNTLTLKTKNLEAIPDLQDQVLAIIDQAGAVDPDQIAQTYAELSQPGFSLFPETLQALKIQAQDLAVDDAKAQFDGFARRCDLQDPRLSTIAPPEHVVYPRVGGAAMEDRAGGSTPIIPDDIAVSARWEFVWSFAQGGTCPLPK